MLTCVHAGIYVRVVIIIYEATMLHKQVAHLIAISILSTVHQRRGTAVVFAVW